MPRRHMMKMPGNDAMAFHPTVPNEYWQADPSYQFDIAEGEYAIWGGYSLQFYGETVSGDDAALHLEVSPAGGNLAVWQVKNKYHHTRLDVDGETVSACNEWCAYENVARGDVIVGPAHVRAWAYNTTGIPLTFSFVAVFAIYPVAA